MDTLYFTPETCALASHVVLEEIGAPYRTVRIDFATEAQRGPDYLAINPKGRVPSLMTPRGVLTETPAILAYLAQRHPEAGLAPLDDPFGFAEAQAFNSYLCSTVHVAHAHRMRGTRWTTEPEAIAALKRGAPGAVAAGFALIEQGMLRGPYVLGDRYSICDAYLFTLARWLEKDGVELARLPRVVAHRALIGGRPAVQRALAAEK